MSDREALPIPESVIANIVTTLKNVSISGGYSVTLTPVERRTLPDNNPTPWKCVVSLEDPELISDQPWPLCRQTLNFVVVVWVPTNEESATSPDTLLQCVWADIQRALYVDRYRGGYAENTRVLTPEYWSDAVSIRVECPCRFRADDPYLKG